MHGTRQYHKNSGYLSHHQKPIKVFNLKNITGIDSSGRFWERVVQFHAKIPDFKPCLSMGEIFNARNLDIRFLNDGGTGERPSPTPKAQTNTVYVRNCFRVYIEGVG